MNRDSVVRFGIENPVRTCKPCSQSLQERPHLPARTHENHHTAGGFRYTTLLDKNAYRVRENVDRGGGRSVGDE